MAGAALNRGYVYRHRARVAGGAQQLLAYQVAHFAQFDAAGWRALIEAGQLRIAGQVARADSPVRPGDLVEYWRDPWVEPAAPLDFTVHFEDREVLVVGKPAGLQVLPAGPFLEHTLFTQVRASDGSRAQASPVHRLGRGTSGLVLFGKTQSARAELSRQLRAFELRKTYLAWVVGTALPAGVIARHPFQEVAHGPLRVHVAAAAGKPTVTRVRVLRRRPAEHCSLVAAQPITGRPDQIRVHLAALGAPILGDPLFGPGGGIISDLPPGQGGYLLHASSLGFVHPGRGQWLKVRALPPWVDRPPPRD